jgi:hypothetical protein
VVAIATLTGLFYAVENWRGAHALNVYKEQCRANGERFDWQSVVPPPVPDERNLAMTPLLKPLLDYERINGRVEWRSSGDEAKEFKMFEKGPRMSGPDSAKLIDLTGWANFFSGENAGQQPAGQVLAGMKRFEPQFKELQQAIGSRPESRWPVRYDENFAALLPHLAVVKDIVIACAVRTAAHLELGRTNEAFDDVKIALALTESIKSDPLLLTHVVRVAMITFTVQAIREGLARDRWSNEQLLYFQDGFAKMNLFPEYQRCMRGERGFSLEAVEMTRERHLGPEFWVGPGSAVPPWAKRPVLRFAPRGWFFQNELGILKFHQEYSLAAVDEDARRVNHAHLADAERALTNSSGPYNVLVQMLVPAVSSALSKSARGQTTLAEASIACALERYRHAHKQYPEKLDQLSSQFLNQIPHDVIDGNPMRYRRESERSYVLYSVGWNGIDDGGIVAAKGKSKDEGDWVWRQPRVSGAEFD